VATHIGLCTNGVAKRIIIFNAWYSNFFALINGWFPINFITSILERAPYLIMYGDLCCGKPNGICEFVKNIVRSHLGTNLDGFKSKAKL
jgi:hypothetical protein